MLGGDCTYLLSGEAGKVRQRDRKKGKDARAVSGLQKPGFRLGRQDKGGQVSRCLASETGGATGSWGFGTSDKES